MATRRQVRRAIELHAEKLSALPDVVGIGADWDIHAAKTGEELEHAVAVYIASYSDGDSPIPATIDIPARRGVHVIPVVVKHVGEIKPEACLDAQQATGSEPTKISGADDDSGEELFYAE